MKKQKINLEKLPIYEIVFDHEKEGSGISRISLVDKPAILLKGMAFSEGKAIDYKFESIPDKQIIAGPACVPGMKILRETDGHYYYVVFKADTIKEMVSKFNRSNNNLSINVDHSDTMVDAFIQANWIIEDQTYDKSKMYGFSLPIGTWFVEVKINDEDFWKESIKKEEKYGFSIEAMLSEKLVEMMEEEINLTIDEVIDSLSDEEVLSLFSTDLYHPNCKCYWENGKLITEPDACDICMAKKNKTTGAPGSKGFNTI